ncbi:hypothetical protein HMI54_006553 [Coelomomyces lativittatus]|nr:hypothetical protein HMI54_006553 [Coelomomyces lativittatus]KAJ1512100.1 hypothetical protein HMI55_006355 [Coelomomyces lativittatus]KAJ1513525.1 hypothetical protein HMI56_002289 [Coelomomyces lativittatus]
MLSSSVVILFVQSEFIKASERRFEKCLTINQLKGKLETITGIGPSQQILRLIPSVSTNNEHDNNIIHLSPDDATLDSFPIENYMTLDVRSISSVPTVADPFANLSETPKYEMPDEQYDRRTDSVRNFKRVNKLGQYSTKKPSKSLNPEIQVGKRCQIFGQNGTIKYVGTVKNEGNRIGIELDEPLGEHDGEYKSIRYFEAKPRSGILAKASDVVVGEFEVIDVLAELEEL